MTVLSRLPEPHDVVWYLAYGSNLSASKFIHDRGIVPLSTAVVEVMGWTLTMDSAGFPYTEPSFGNISPVFNKGGKCVQLIGTAYQLTPDMYHKVLSSEGGGIAYTEIEVRAVLLEPGTSEKKSDNPTFAVRSLVTVLPRKACPSQRYMNLVRGGAADAHMPSEYQEFLASLPVYHPPTDSYHRLGADLFIAFWVPVMSLMESITKANLKGSRTGDAPPWVIFLVRTVMFLMWSYHDYVHAPVWGRGDGLEDGDYSQTD